MNYRVDDFECKRDDLIIRGRYYLPLGLDKPPVLLISHGFMSMGDALKDYAEAFAEIGYASFIYDFNGGGIKTRSTGKTTDMSVLTEVQDLKAIIQYVKGMEFLDSSRITLLGESQGGLVSALTAAELGKEEIEKLILYYPALCIPDDARRGHMMFAKFDPKNIPEQVKCGPMKLGRCYVDDVKEMDPYELIPKYDGPLLLIHGTNDKVVNINYANRAFTEYLKSGDKTEKHYVVLDGAGHGFSGKNKSIAIESTKQFLTGFQRLPYETDFNGLKPMPKFKWCFIGTGTLAKQIAGQLQESGRHEIVSCYTRNYEHGKEFAKKYGTTAYEKAEDAILAEGVDAVYVVTPHNAHFRYVKQALELGKPVLCEKPFTVRAEETDQLIALAKEKNLYLCEAMWTWFSPAANKTKQWIDEKKTGSINSVEFSYNMKSVNYAERVADPKRAGGALLDTTIYPITYAYRLFGKPIAAESTGVIENGIDLSEQIVLTFENGIKANISGSIVDMKGLEKMSINGDKGQINAIFYHAMNKVTFKKGLLETESFSGPGPRMNSYLDEFDTVADEIRRGLKESRMVPLQATSDVMHILDEIRGQIGLEYTDLE